MLRDVRHAGCRWWGGLYTTPAVPLMNTEILANKPAILVNTMVVDKGKPRMQPVPQ